ncbi:bifunctional hydroxymethylpyrimidine kinase/phosphomethylpyrimidine kinase [Silvibacterium dinghuense]|uniref:hydroxymethylpyrimidine kinase n=1 Tax=Silvibacterium dinghuense TaxID=1560006 RepID=A0A4Q1S846_9BACT|nr:bifunctional hydroxymethylpyrimidine kinase/phosphomethylpyrimidine kinase [Silvibacterium dinghuense]RXS93065.1 bifunctional hydroxymethylpyrimidine kinase/phosphomethylpyrimidine kinase [Silvibacterium dinghuense]GGG89683.1 hydroxymethylpyrimidine/phosphomethylpyrimidine kinase [Silvibacterium dinghuense]
MEKSYKDAGRPVVLTIAGFDPSSGAGITADLKVFAAHRLYGLSAITALTVQSTQGVRRMEPVSAKILADTLACLAEDGPISGVKIGMLGTATNVEAVVHFLQRTGIERRRVVLDPVIRSSSGRELLGADGVSLLKSHLLDRAGWVTPNREELWVLAEEPELAIADANSDYVVQRAAALARCHAGLRIVATGGEEKPPNDLLWTENGGPQWFPGERIETRATHGTGCAFSSALLAAIVAGASDAEAVFQAKSYVREAMLAAYPVGRGRGPMHHLAGLEFPGKTSTDEL